MIKIILLTLISLLVQSCASSNLTPEEKQELRERHERLLEARELRN